MSKRVPGKMSDNRKLYIPRKAVTLFGIIIGFGTWAETIRPAEAISLRLTPIQQELTVGEALSLDVAIADLGPLAAPSVSTFDLDIAFDSTVLEFTGLTFGDPQLGDQVDRSGDARQFTEQGIFEAIGFRETRPGVVNLFEVSLDTPEDLNILQPDTFTLATLDFKAFDIGSSDFTLTVNALGDSEGNPLALDLINSTSVVVTGTSSKSVPEPMTSWLGLLGFVVAGSCGITKTRIS